VSKLISILWLEVGTTCGLIDSSSNAGLIHAHKVFGDMLVTS
jgi:hypothetical protein